MAALVRGLVLLLVLLGRPVIVVLSNSSTDDLQAVLVALEKLVTYFERNQQHINLDGFFGLRVIEGQLQLLISEYQAGSHQHLSQDVIEKFIYLKLAAQNASSIGLESVRKDDAEYFRDFSPLVSSPWTIMKPRRKLEASLRWEIPQYKAKMKVKLIEQMSDRCMTELTKSGGRGCEISDECIQIMTTRGLSGYGITHQVLWSIVGEIMPNCNVSLNKVLALHNMGNISTFQQELCTNNFYEMVAVVQVLMHGKVHESHQDLFLEQQFVCPNLGFYEFMKKDYLDQILSWQFPSGCFGEHGASQSGENDLDLASLLEGYHDSNAKFVPEVQKLDSGSNVKKMKIIASANENIKQVDDILKAKISGQNIRPNQSLSQEPSVFKGDVVLRVPRHVILSKASTSKLHQQPVNKLPGNTINSVNQENNLKSAYVNKIDNQILSEHQHISSYGKKMENRILHSVHMAENSHDKNLATLSYNSRLTSLSKDKPLPKKKDSRKLSTDSHHHTLLENSKHTLMGRGKNVSPDNVSEQTAKIGRRLLVEKDLEGGCLSHKTGVGSGALVMYLRYLIEPGNISWTGQHELFMSDSRNLLQATGEGTVVEADEDAAHGNEEDEEDEDEDEKMEQEEGTLNDAVSYSEGNDMEAGDDQGDDDYNEEQADNGGDGAGKAAHETHLGTDHEGDAVIINEDIEKDSEIYAENNDKIVPDAHKKTVRDTDDDDADQEEDHNYYDDEGETERGIIKRRKPPTSRPHPPVKTRRKHSEHLVSKEPLYGQGPELLVPDHPNYVIILFVSVAPFFILFIFLFRFIRKRRVHIRYYF